MPRVSTLPALVCLCAAPACFNPPNTPLATESTADASTTGGTTAPSSSSTVDPTTGPDPDTTAGPGSSSSDTGETTTAAEPPEIEVSIDGRVIEAGGSFVLADTVAVDAIGPAVTITVSNLGTEDLLVGGVLAMGPNASQVVLDQAGLAATIAGGDSSTFTASLAPTTGGIKDIALRIGSNDDDENPFDLVLAGHTSGNTYRLIPTTDGPTGRFNSALTDLGDGRLLLFGGRDAAGQSLADTWVFEVATSSWTLLTPPTSPPIRFAHGMARVDEDTVVMFGGSGAGGGGGGLGDTWLFQIPTEQWSPLVPPPGPPARFQHGMVAIGDGRVLLYGGRTAAGAEMSDTWIFDGAGESWAPAAAAGAPPTNSSFALAFDRDDLVTMYGGFQNNNPLNQTWRYTVSTNTWANANPLGTPGARAVLSGEYLEHGRMIVFSGKLNDCCIDPTGGTFAYDSIANSWTLITPPLEPSPRFNYAMERVAGANKAILFGGLLQNTGVGTALAETWEYVGNRP